MNISTFCSKSIEIIFHIFSSQVGVRAGEVERASGEEAREEGGDQETRQGARQEGTGAVETEAEEQAEEEQVRQVRQGAQEVEEVAPGQVPAEEGGQETEEVLKGNWIKQ